jgi:Fe-S oxidoreductase
MKTLKTKSMEQAQKIGQECVGCNKCMKNCPMLKQHCSSPKTLFKEIAETGAVDREFVFSCTGCDYCNHVCPKQLDIKAFCYEVKRECVADNKSLNKKGQLTVVNFHKASTHPLFTYMDKEVKSGQIDTVFLPGCSLSSAHPKLVKQILDRLNRVEAIGLFVDCCGNPIYSVGDEERFMDNVNRLNRLFKGYGIKKIITACGNCQKMFDAYYDVEVEDLWCYMNTHSDHFIEKPLSQVEGQSFILHDPCSFRKREKTHRAVRDLLTKMGIDVKEFDDNRDSSPCCGAGGMMELIKPRQALLDQRKRSKQAGDHEIISYCQSCVDGFSKVSDNGVHLLELLFQSETRKKQELTTITRWYNRFVVGNILK